MFGADGDKANLVARGELAEFPTIGGDYGDRAHESAEAGPVRAEQDRGVAGEVEGADGVRVVVDVRRVQARFAAVGAGPLGLRADEADAGAIGVEMDFVIGADDGVEIVAGEELRCAVWTFGDGEFPAVGEGGLVGHRDGGGEAGRRCAQR